MTARKPGARRGRPVEISAPVIIAIRDALARGESVATVAKVHGISRRYCRDLAFDAALRPDAVEVPPEIAALDTLEGTELASEALEIREIWGILAGRS